MEAFGPAHVYLFMGWVRDRCVSAGTQHRRQREVKAFFSWCLRVDYVEENPFMRVRYRMAKGETLGTRRGVTNLETWDEASVTLTDMPCF